ncbi:N-acetylglucosamine-6-phosphate deacetylase [Coleofasciculus sp. FACHB-1120]|uniref:N-acetylglucosamine-6-phosphate deacetylase n=1 Tax=Coleofasciculus sp. FACHB-1120 TaxID=2692783 RepID=UPI00168846F3|nr:N-acetylglucosamine-6-phosphate deacetylase [Coleofasciculus sp. FACHB-1120]MBD2744655.1 N-acetylglucosamine-6-phosphate deacetylase [Coleofasciculus sp. FACHB-1120]
MTDATTLSMTAPIVIRNARFRGYESLQQIWIHQGRIEQILSMETVFKMVPPEDLQVLDVEGDWVSLGGVDLQINGALGLAFPELNLENCDKLPEICKFLWNQGVDGFLPTIVTTSVENIQRSLSIFSNFVASPNQDRATAQILGVHLEGPFLNPQKRGAHPAEYLLPLTIDNVKRVLGDYAGIVKAITLAPELDRTGEAIAYLRSLGITVSLGHSQATEAQAQQAFKLGASMVTHAFNAMPGLHHREPGLLGAALVHPAVQCGLIADGQHVSQTMIQLLLRASSTSLNQGQQGELSEQGIFLVSDALAPLGLPDGIYPWDTRQIEVKNGTARLRDGTLSGTTLPLLVGVQNLVRWGICEVETAIALATESPRRAIGLLKEPSKRDRQKNNKTSPYLSQPAHQLLRWHLDESTNELTWQRLLPNA